MPSVKKNYLYSILYQVLTIIVPLITAPYLTRIMGVERLGEYSYSNSIAYYFYLFSILGMSNYGNRTIASIRDNREELNRVFSELVVLQISFGTVVFITYVVYVFSLFPTNILRFNLSMIWGMYVLSGFLDISWFFWGIERFSVTVARNIIIKIFTVISIFIFVRNKNDLLVYVFITAFGSVIGTIVVWIQLRGSVSIVRISLKNVYKHFKPDLILFIPVIAVSIYTVMDKIMLGKFSEMNELGFYDNIQKIMTVPTSFITALGTVMLPRMSNLIANGKKGHVLNFLEMSMQFSNFFSMALSFGLAAVAPCFTVVYFGSEFSDTSDMMVLFCITIIFIAWANVIRTQYLIPSGKDNIYIISVISGAIVNIGINLILIPSLKAKGAIIGTICAEFTVAFIQTVLIRKELNIRKYLANGIVYVIPGGLMFLCVRFVFRLLGTSVISLIIQVLVGIITYLLLGGLIFVKADTVLSNAVKKEVRKLFRGK